MLHKLTSAQIPNNTQISKGLVVIVVVDKVLETLIQPDPLLLAPIIWKDFLTADPLTLYSGIKSEWDSFLQSACL